MVSLLYSGKRCHNVFLSVKIMCFMCVLNVLDYEVILCVTIMCFICVPNVSCPCVPWGKLHNINILQ